MRLFSLALIVALGLGVVVAVVEINRRLNALRLDVCLMDVEQGVMCHKIQ